MWKSSPYWPAKRIYQYRCAECGYVVVSSFAPSISPSGLLYARADGRHTEEINIYADCDKIKRV